jgi:hypothetical protein
MKARRTAARGEAEGVTGDPALRAAGPAAGGDAESQLRCAPSIGSRACRPAGSACAAPADGSAAAAAVQPAGRALFGRSGPAERNPAGLSIKGRGDAM